MEALDRRHERSVRNQPVVAPSEDPLGGQALEEPLELPRDRVHRPDEGEPRVEQVGWGLAGRRVGRSQFTVAGFYPDRQQKEVKVN